MKADLHLHSLHSEDGEQNVDAILRKCSELGIGAISITDHNSLQGSLDAEKNGYGIIILPGEEVTTSEGGHILAYGISKTVPKGLSIKDTIKNIHDQGGIAVAAHPFRLGSGMGRMQAESGDFDAVETLNGRSRKRVNQKSKEIAMRKRIGEVGGSDAHQVESIGRSYTVFPDDVKNVQDMLVAIRNRQTKGEGKSRSLLGSISNALLGIVRWGRRGFKKI